MKSLLAVLFLAMAAVPAVADEIVLRDGRRISWKSVSDDGDTYAVEMRDGKKVTLKKSEVDRFATGDSAPDAKPLSGASFTLDAKRVMTVDLVPKAKTEGTAGAWKPAVRSLVNTGENPGRVTLSFDHELPDEYDLVLQVERVSGNGGFEVGIVQGEATSAFHFDAFGATSSFFGMISGQFGAKTEGQIFRPGKARTVKVSVRRDAVLIQLDGKEIWKSRIDWRAATLFGDVPAPERKRPFLVASGGMWKVSAFTITANK